MRAYVTYFFIESKATVIYKLISTPALFSWNLYLGPPRKLHVINFTEDVCSNSRDNFLRTEMNRIEKNYISEWIASFRPLF